MQMAANDAIDMGKGKPLHIVGCEYKPQAREDPLIRDSKNTWFAVPPAIPSSSVLTLPDVILCYIFLSYLFMFYNLNSLCIVHLHVTSSQYFSEVSMNVCGGNPKDDG